MGMSRRKFLVLAAGLAATPLLPRGSELVLGELPAAGAVVPVIEAEEFPSVGGVLWITADGVCWMNTCGVMTKLSREIEVTGPNGVWVSNEFMNAEIERTAGTCHKSTSKQKLRLSSPESGPWSKSRSYRQRTWRDTRRG